MRKLLAALGLSVLGAASAWGQMSADRPTVLRSKTDVHRLVDRYRTSAQRLQDQGPTGASEGVLVWRMRTATGQLAHQYKTSTQVLADQAKTSRNSEFVSVAPDTTYYLVLRRKFEEPLAAQSRTATSQTVAQFPSSSDFTR